MGGQDKRGGHPKYGDLIVELTFCFFSGAQRVPTAATPAADRGTGGWQESVLQRVRFFAAILAPNRRQLPPPGSPIEVLGLGGNWHSQGCHSFCCSKALTGTNSDDPWLPIEAHGGGESWRPQGTFFALTLALARYQSLPPWLPIAAHADGGNRSP